MAFKNFYKQQETNEKISERPFKSGSDYARTDDVYEGGQQMIPKFRAYSTEENKMYYPHSDKNVDWTIDNEAGFIAPSVNLGDGMWGMIDKYKLMQATGLKNCETPDGKKCDGWEGDIAEIGWSDVVGEFHYHKIVLKNQIEYTSDEFWWLINCHYIKILGNIYENPDLLEAK